MGWRPKAMLATLVLLAIAFAWAALARAFAPTGNTSASRFDTLIVLGAEVDADGNPPPLLLSRINEAVREYERGIAPRMILSGGLSRRRFVEASVMARAAEAEGVPASAILLEPAADDTIQNACFAARIMKAHGWRSAEVISTASHLPRTGLIFHRLSHKQDLNWRTHVAPPLEPQSSISIAVANALEIPKTVRYLLYADWAEPCTP